MSIDENEATHSNSNGKAIIEPCSTVVRTSFTHASITEKPPTTGNVTRIKASGQNSLTESAQRKTSGGPSQKTPLTSEGPKSKI